VQRCCQTLVAAVTSAPETVIVPSQTSLITACHGAPVIQLRAAPLHRKPLDLAAHSGSADVSHRARVDPEACGMHLRVEPGLIPIDAGSRRRQP
jgi:hypothetical protein